MSNTKATKSKKVEEMKSEPVKTEPVVETKPDEVNETDVNETDVEESKKQSFDDVLEMMQERYKELRQQMLAFGGMMAQLKRSHNQTMRQQSQKKKTRKVVVDSGILKPVPLPDEARAFLTDVKVAIPENGLVRRTELTGAIFDYVKANSLYKPDPSKETGFDRKVIIPDAKLRKLFSLSADKTLDFSSINQNLAVIYRHAREMTENNTTTSAAAPASAAAKAPAAPVKKGKAAGSSA
jgi:hypothetical protein